MYTWGYLQSAALAKLDLDEYDNQDEVTSINLLNRFRIYANEAMTQICSSVKPKRSFYEVNIYDYIKYDTEDGIIVNGITLKAYQILPDKRITDIDGNILFYPVGYRIKMPTDFISFSDDNSTVKYHDFMNNIWYHECHDDDVWYCGYNEFYCKHAGEYQIAYNARWFNFDGVSDDTIIDVPNDVLDCIPSYIASQCYKIDDEYKSSVFRNEYEMFLARIDDTDFKNTHTITIEGDW